MKLVPASREYDKIRFDWRKEEIAQKFNPMIDYAFEDFIKVCEAQNVELNQIEDQGSCRKVALVDDIPVGSVGLFTFNPRMLTAEVGYNVGQKNHGKGYGGKMVSLFFEEVFEQTELRKITAHVHVENIASQKILEKLGFVKEGLLRAHFVVNGKVCDELLYGLLRNEFKPI